MIDFWKTAFSIGSELQDSKDKSNTMDQLGIIERLEAKIDRLTSLVLNLYDTSGDGIGRVMNKKEAAEYLGISIGAIDQRMAKGAIPFVKNNQGHVRFAEYYLKRCELGEDAKFLQDEIYKKFPAKRK